MHSHGVFKQTDICAVGVHGAGFECALRTARDRERMRPRTHFVAPIARIEHGAGARHAALIQARTGQLNVPG